MTEDELKALKDLPAPPPRGDAKAVALAAAMAAFDAGVDAATPEKNSADATQGNDAGLRPIHASQADRRRTMRAPMLYKIAAGIAVVVVATPAALYVVDRYSPETLTSGYQPLIKDIAPPRSPAEEAALRRDAGKADESGRPVAPKTEAETSTPPIPGRAQEQQAAQTQPAPISADQSAPPADGKPSPSAQTGRQVPDSDKLAYGRLDDRDEPAKPEAKVAGAERRKESEPDPLAGVTVAPPSPSEAPMVSGRPLGFTAKPGSAGAGAPAPRQPMAGIIAPNASAPSIAPPPPPADRRVIVQEEKNRDQFEAKEINPVKQVAAEPVSTFSIDVDSASYSFVRRALNEGRLPPKDSVRIEEMINYFPYDYPRPDSSEVPFRPTVTVTPAPWKPTNKLIHIGIKGYDVVPAERPRANIVLLIDISGSMASADKLPLVKNAFRMMVDELKPDDTVGIVTYASGSGIALEPTKVLDRAKILAALDALGAGGSTAGAAGINDAYRLAEANLDKTGVNRIILATDGDFNVGISNKDELKGFIERKRAGGIFLSILGVGQGNYNDALMQTLAQNGNGTAAYVDTLNEARKVLVDEASSTLFTIAKDVKIQMEFNPATVSEYRLIGYETRALRREDFNNDKVDAGDIGSGHTVTAIYEVTPVGAPKLVDDLRYGKPDAAAAPVTTPDPTPELGFLKLRYKLPKEDASKLISVPVTSAMEKPDLASAPEDVRFSVAAAAFGQILRGQPYVASYSYDDVLALAQTARGSDPFGYRAEFLNLVRLAKSARP
jgi:Ca-activated chloride channel family protein